MKHFLPVFRSVGIVSGNPRDLSAEYERLQEPDEDRPEDWLTSLRFSEAFQAGLRERLESRWGGVPFEKTRFYVTGQSHIDVAWKWRFSQTIRKAIVTYTKAVWHINHHPRFCFAASQPVLLDWVRQEDRRLFSSIKAAVRTGRFDLVGGMWLEPDCRLPSGESLVRQRLYGQRFYLKHFGKTSDVEWVPDSFGYASTLPQIFLKSGSRYFFTVKLHDQSRPFPFVHFLWQSPDGSQLLTCLNPDLWDTLDRFAATRTRRRLLKPDVAVVADYTCDRLEQGDHFSAELPEICAVIGRGDGGHGPTGEEVAVVDHLASKRSVQWISATAYFQSMLEKHRARLPVWNDELYYELHRGTLTTQSQVKRINRYFEWRLCTIEKLTSLALMLRLGDSGRWADRFERIWKLVLLNQFHDVLPGSSIPEVFDDSFDLWQVAKARLDRTEDAAWRLLAGRRSGSAKKGQGRLLFNATGFDLQSVPVEVPLAPGEAPRGVVVDGQPVPMQRIEGEAEGGCAVLGPRPARALFVVSAAQHSLKQIRFSRSPAVPPAGSLSFHRGRPSMILENEYYRLAVNTRTGAIRSVFSKEMGFELLQRPGVRLRGFYDWLPEEQCWNILPDYRQHELEVPAPSRVSVVETGPVRLSVEITRTFFNGRSASAANGESTIRHRISLYSGARGIQMDFLLDWRSCECILKLDISTRTQATSVVAEVPYGSDSRRTKPVTSHDRARWENFHHTWVDLSADDGSWGLGVINRGKYGYDARRGRLGLSLIRGPLYPPPAPESWVNQERERRSRSHSGSVPTHTDHGAHLIQYILLPHRGGWSNSFPFLPAIAHWFNEGYALSPIGPGSVPVAHDTALVQCLSDDAELSALKPAEGRAGFILRITEVKRRRATVSIALHPALGIRSVTEVDLLERELASQAQLVKAERGGLVKSFSVTLQPHEIKTVRLQCTRASANGRLRNSS